MSGADVSFVHLGISIPHMVKSFSIGGISFAYYGLIIGIGMILGLCVAQSDAKRRGQDPDIYLDFALYGIIFSIIGARIYYVFFQWAYYKDHLILDNGIEYIQVHPTFLYESLWNFGLLMFMLWFRKRKTFTGEMLCIYLAGYGIGRAWIEGLRTDSLLIPGTQIAVSQALSVVLATVSLVILIYNRRKAFVQGKEAN